MKFEWLVYMEMDFASVKSGKKITAL